jgi:hypothetical protein
VTKNVYWSSSSACQNLMNIEFFFLQIFEKHSSITCHEIPPGGAELFHVDRRTDMTKLVVAFRNFANASKKKRKLARVCTGGSAIRRSTKTERMFSQYTHSYILITSEDILTKP